MSDWLMRVIKAEAKQLLGLAADDDELRTDLRALATEILVATEKVDVQTKLCDADDESAATVERTEPDVPKWESRSGS